jgi:Trk-type K+ transport system membrane component
MTEKENFPLLNVDDLIDYDARLSDRQFQRKLESYRAERDFYKHLTSLSTASVILIATFLEKAFPNAEWTELVNVSLGAFAVSVVGCACMYALAVLDTDSELSLHKQMPTRWVWWLPITAGLGGFFVGIAALAAFAMHNLS